jgi:hypothetical protein
MKRVIVVAALLAVLGIPLTGQLSPMVPQASAQDGPLTMPDQLILAKESKLGPVTFNHADHATKNHNIAGNAPITCVTCHHTAQPAAEVTKNPLHKTAWPADRTTTLTLDLIAKGAAAVGDINCDDCHARAGTTPKTWPEIPTIKAEGSDQVITVTNQVAFHRNCGSCHEQVLKARPDAKAPAPQKCSRCHSK